MTNKISLTTLLIDIRSRNLMTMTQCDITRNLNERGYCDSLNEVQEKLEALGRLVNPTLTTSFTGCVWCGNLSVNSDKLCRSCEP